jgi:NAD-dependent dihydropyrimidine dehydrogenase PreA subunit
MPYVITGKCKDEIATSCIDVCPVDCIHPAEGYTIEGDGKEKMKAAGEQLYINPEDCIECGACAAECPVEAIFPDDELPEDMLEYIEINASKFA